MIERAHVVGRVSLLLLLGPCLVQCRKQAAPEPARVEVPAPSAAAAASAKPAPSTAEIGPLGPAAAAEQPFPGQDLSVGKWIDTSAYKFRVNRVQRCADPEPGTATPPDRPVRVGVSVDVLSKYDQFFLSGRDVHFEKDGVVIDSERGAKASAGCSPVLEPKRLEHDQSAGGVVIFQLPDEAFARSGKVTFHPTRWGGAPRAEVKVKDVDFRALEKTTSPKP